MTRRLAFKLILSLTLLVAVVEGIFGVFSVSGRERQVVSLMVQGADQLSRSIASATWHAMLADNREAAYQTMETIATKQGIDRIRIFNKEGRVMWSTGPEEGALVDKKAEACFICHAEAQPLVKVDVPSRARTFRGADGTRKLSFITPIYNEPACIRADCHAHPASRSVLGVLDVTLDLGPIDVYLSDMKRRAFLMLGVQVVVLGAFIALFTRRFVSRPIRDLVRATHRVAEMRLDEPIAIDSSEEIGRLGRSFEQMRLRLREAVEAQNSFAQSLEDRVAERTEQLRIAQQKLVQSDRLASLGQLAASVAHEINNPLSGVLNLSMLMQRVLKPEGVPPGRVEEFRGYLAQVAQETARVGRIVSDLLAFSRRSAPQRVPSDLNAVVRRTVSLVGHKLDLSGVRVDLRLQEDLPRVVCDPGQIQQVILNLVLNGAESMAGPGELTVATQPWRNGEVALEVRDTGSGIAPENLGRIFDPFFTTKEEGKGVGLGLAVVYGIVQAHGGDIEVDSAPGRGTTFRVLLPRASADGA